MGGCFLACFGPKEDDRKRRNRRKNKLVAPRDQKHGSHKPLQPTLSLEQETPAEVAKQISEIQIKPEELLSVSTRKKVTFDTNVKTYEPVPVYESVEVLPKSNGDGENPEEDSSEESALSKADSIASSVGSYPPNYRYQNCRDSDDELDESEFEDSDLDDEDEDEDYVDYDEADNHIIVGQEEWSEMIPAESMESTTEPFSAAAFTDEAESNPIKSSFVDKEEKKFRDRSVYVHPVLNPVENLTQWKAVKSKGMVQPLKPQKENFSVDLEVRSEPVSNFRSKSCQFKHQSEEISVDASLSNWLGSSETSASQKSSFTGTVTSEGSMSNGSQSVVLEDRPILGALTVEELKQHSASSSPRKSPSRSPDDMPILGTVGTYWNHKEPVKNSGSAPFYKAMPSPRSYRGVYVK